MVRVQFTKKKKVPHMFIQVKLQKKVKLNSKRSNNIYFSGFGLRTLDFGFRFSVSVSPPIGSDNHRSEETVAKHDMPDTSQWHAVVRESRWVCRLNGLNFQFPEVLFVVDHISVIHCEFPGITKNESFNIQV